ncbi:hypothetical protein BS50DRAFT_298392 [Corynespora cassiicola Philippines]|uniref:Uncharacterized protein n=1 Tax=Corynespora cassiicola Philippines TaxID=1448308 RepID=A0A2T2NWT2_CORCC|nr:hypothetical protein BS50DRAFT_298392 [Corynespora cassiicola Philippines]
MEGWTTEAERHGVEIISNCTITVLPDGENIPNPPNSVSTLSCSMQSPLHSERTFIKDSLEFKSLIFVTRSLNFLGLCVVRLTGTTDLRSAREKIYTSYASFSLNLAVKLINRILIMSDRIPRALQMPSSSKRLHLLYVVIGVFWSCYPL